MRNLLIDNYLNEFNRKQLNNKKASISEWIRVFIYFAVIIREIVCLNINDKQSRLYLADITLFIGGIRQFNHYTFIIYFTFALVILKLFHFSSDKHLMSWIKLLEVFNGTLDHRIAVFTKHLDDFNKIQLTMTKFYPLINLFIINSSM